MSGCTFTMCCCPRGNDITQFFRLYYLSFSLPLLLSFFSVYLFINLSIQLFIHLLFIYLFVHPSIYPFIDPFNNSSIHSTISEWHWLPLLFRCSKKNLLKWIIKPCLAISLVESCTLNEMVEFKYTVGGK